MNHADAGAVYRGARFYAWENYSSASGTALQIYFYPDAIAIEDNATARGRAMSVREQKPRLPSSYSYRRFGFR